MSMKRQIVFTDLAWDTEEGAAARLLDPLWLLSRQWQMGELQGEDTGTPVRASLDVEAATLCAWQPGSDAASPVYPYDPRGRPLEALVEGEAWSTPATPHLRLATESGLLLLRLLRARGLTSAERMLIQRAPLAMPAQIGDVAGQRLARLHSGRSVDGLQVRRHLDALVAMGDSPLAGVFTDLLLDCTDDRAVVQVVLAAWHGTWAALPAGQVESVADVAPALSWQSSRAEYAFCVAAQMSTGAVGLRVPEHLGGSADWYDFVIGSTGSMPSAGRSGSKRFEFVPSLVRFSGMPNPRFWEFEDGRMNLPRLRVNSARSDPGSQLMLDFALRYGSDWFMLPLPLPAGSVSRIQAITVRDSFGDVFRLPSFDQAGRAARATMLSVVPGSSGSELAFSDIFLLPATCGQSLDSAPVEQVRLVRDEMANLAWAIELVVEGPFGQKIDRTEQSSRARPAEAPPAGSGAMKYRLGTEVPPHWIPLVPEAGHRLRRKSLPHFTEEGVKLLPPEGRLMERGRELVLLDEEVPWEGLNVDRRYRFVRSADGAPTLWMARRKGPGEGRIYAGLRFDIVT